MWKKTTLLLGALLVLVPTLAQETNTAHQSDTTMQKFEFRMLSPEEERVIIDKGTERPFTREY